MTEKAKETKTEPTERQEEKLLADMVDQKPSEKMSEATVPNATNRLSEMRTGNLSMWSLTGFQQERDSAYK